MVPPRHEVLDHAPQLVATLRVEAGGGLVEEQHRRPVHQRGGEVEPAAHATGVGADDAVGGVLERELLEQLVGPAVDLVAVEVREPADQPRFSRPVRFSSTAAYWPASPIEARTALRVLRDVDAEHAGVARVGPQQRREHAHRRWSCRRRWARAARAPALRHLERDALDRLDVAEALHQVVGDDRRFCHGSPP